jgi:hypothetical protein
MKDIQTIGWAGFPDPSKTFATFAETPGNRDALDTVPGVIENWIAGRPSALLVSVAEDNDVTSVLDGW